MNIEALRREYKYSVLNDGSVDPDPIEQFQIWFEEAMRSGIDEVNSMTLATAGKNGQPSARIVLLKSITVKGFTFFTNYEGRKSRELEENPQAALVFYWKELDRQVRIEGRVVKVSDEESEKYFQSRSYESRISATVSPQSTEVPSRRHLEEIWEKKHRELEGKNFPRPGHWGGFRVIPDRIEFWQGRPDRLHDRILYSLNDGKWRISRLAP